MPSESLTFRKRGWRMPSWIRGACGLWRAPASPCGSTCPPASRTQTLQRATHPSKRDSGGARCRGPWPSMPWPASSCLQRRPPAALPHRGPGSHRNAVARRFAAHSVRRSCLAGTRYGSTSMPGSMPVQQHSSRSPWMYRLDVSSIASNCSRTTFSIPKRRNAVPSICAGLAPRTPAWQWSFNGRGPAAFVSKLMPASRGVRLPAAPCPACGLTWPTARGRSSNGGPRTVSWRHLSRRRATGRRPAPCRAIPRWANSNASAGTRPPPTF